MPAEITVITNQCEYCVHRLNKLGEFKLFRGQEVTNKGKKPLFSGFWLWVSEKSSTFTRFFEY